LAVWHSGFPKPLNQLSLNVAQLIMSATQFLTLVLVYTGTGA